MSTAKQRVSTALKKFQHKPLMSIGTLGNTAGVVDVPGKSNYVYVTVPGSGTLVVYNTRVAAVPGQPVELGRDPLEPDQYQVINVHKYPQVNPTTAPVIGGTAGKHAPTHNWSGNDPVYIEKRQLMPLRVTATGDMNVFVTREATYYDNGWQFVSGTNLDMTGYAPTTGSLYALVYKDTQEHIKVSTSGTLRDTTTLTLNDAPQPYPGTVPLALVRLYGGQSGIYDNSLITDIVDVRPLFDAGSSGITTGTVTLAMMGNMATASLIYRKTAGSGAPEVNSLATLKTDLGSMPAAAHNILDSTYHADTLTGSVLDGSIIIGNVTPAWSAMAIAIPAANVRNVLGIDNGELRPSWKTALDATNPATLTAAGAAAAGTSLVFAHRDHVHAITAAPALLGNGTSQYQTIITGVTPFAPVYSGFLLDGTTGGKTILAVTSGKTLTLTAVDNFSLTLEASTLLNQDLTTDAGPSFAHLHLADVAAIYTAAESWIGPSATAGIYFKGGNVGIGTTSPAGKLEVAGIATAAVSTHNKGISFTGTLVEPSAGYYSAGLNVVPTYGNGSSNMADAIGIYIGGPTKGTSGTITNIFGMLVDVNSAAATNAYGIKIVSPAGGTSTNYALQTTGTGIVAIAGNVGIGTTSPSRQLHVLGAGQATAALTDAGNKGGTIYIQDSGNGIDNGGALVLGSSYGVHAAIKALVQDGGGNSAGDLAFSLRRLSSDTAMIEMMRINSAGYVGIGTATIPSMLTVNGLINMKNYTVATLPAGTRGDICYCTDLLLPGFLAVAAGGGAVVGLVFRNATTWVTA